LRYRRARLLGRGGLRCRSPRVVSGCGSGRVLPIGLMLAGGGDRFLRRAGGRVMRGAAVPRGSAVSGSRFPMVPGMR
jgi:hypothetical protein